MLSLSKFPVEPDEILVFLKETLSFKDVYKKILRQRVVNQAIQERGLVVASEEVNAEAERLRRDLRLERASETLAWLQEEMITPDDWEAGIRDRLLSNKLAEHLFHKDVEKFYAQNKLDFEQILLYQVVVPFERVAQELFYQIEEQEISFYEAAHLYDIDEKRRHQCGFEGKLYRWNLKPDIAAIVFQAQLKEVVGPLQTEQGYHLFMVEELIPAELTPQRHQELLDNLFKEWLESELNYMLHNTS